MIIPIRGPLCVGDALDVYVWHDGPGTYALSVYQNGEHASELRALSRADVAVLAATLAGLALDTDASVLIDHAASERDAARLNRRRVEIFQASLRAKMRGKAKN